MDGKPERPVEIRILLPHEVLHCLATCASEAVFQSVVLGNLDEKARSEFWQHVKTLAPWAAHPALNEDGFEGDHLVGLTFHMDGAQYFREDEFVTWSFSSVFANSGLINDVLMYQFPFAIIADRHMLSPNVT